MTSGARLEVVAGNAMGLSLEVQGEEDLLIGRHVAGPGRLGEDDELSRAHARISLDAGGMCAIEDLGSTNGTFVNGLRISTPQLLAVGDTVEVGASTLVLREPAPTPAQAGAELSASALSLRLEVDFEGHEVQLKLSEDSDPVHLVFDAGAWRARSQPIEKGELA